MGYQRLQITLPKEHVRYLNDIAEFYGLTKSQVIKIAVKNMQTTSPEFGKPKRSLPGPTHLHTAQGYQSIQEKFEQKVQEKKEQKKQQEIQEEEQQSSVEELEEQEKEEQAEMFKGQEEDDEEEEDLEGICEICREDLVIPLEQVIGMHKDCVEDSSNEKLVERAQRRVYSYKDGGNEHYSPVCIECDCKLDYLEIDVGTPVCGSCQETKSERR